MRPVTRSYYIRKESLRTASSRMMLSSITNILGRILRAVWSKKAWTHGLPLTHTRWLFSASLTMWFLSAEMLTTRCLQENSRPWRLTWFFSPGILQIQVPLHDSSRKRYALTLTWISWSLKTAPYLKHWLYNTAHNDGQILRSDQSSGESHIR